jgi:SAM-dependent methyltransferase
LNLKAKPRFKTLCKSLLPQALQDVYTQWKVEREFRGLTPAEVFTKIYRDNRWGGQVGDFDSGIGSNPQWTSAYCEFVSRFIVENHVTQTLDLGCGDFRVGSRLPGKVIGADIVPPLIERNRRLFPEHEFLCLDMTTDDLPQADLCLIRQVFQHLSNAQIISVLRKLQPFKYVLVTEHQWVHSRTPNLDKVPGPHVRERSGVFLSDPPFNQPCKPVLTVQLSEEEVLQTVLINSR